MPDTLGVIVAVAAIARSPWTSHERLESLAQRCFMVSPNSLLVNGGESEQSASASDTRWMRFLRTSCVQPLQQAARSLWCFSSGEKVARLVNAKKIPITPYLKLRPLGMRRLSIEIRDISGNRNIGLTEKQPLPLCRLLTLLLNCPCLQWTCARGTAAF